jgi:hypothetical protein
MNHEMKEIPVCCYVSEFYTHYKIPAECTVHTEVSIPVSFDGNNFAVVYISPTFVHYGQPDERERGKIRIRIGSVFNQVRGSVSGFGIRIRIPDPGVQKLPTKMEKKFRNFIY